MDTASVELQKNLISKSEDALKQLKCLPLPETEAIQRAEASLIQDIPKTGRGLHWTSEHVSTDIVPGLNGSSLSPNYYGFVTGGVTPAARVADRWTSLLDQNVSVHLPKETIATVVEDRGIRLLLELLGFKNSEWPSRTLTTGATASNILGLACGRQWVIETRAKQLGQRLGAGESFLSACRKASIDDFQILSTMPHSSLAKAASIVGIGSTCIVDLSRDGDILRFDLGKLEAALSRSNRASIVAISCGEVNTGHFATKSFDELRAIREICDRYGAWIHVDGAFGIFASLLPRTPEYEDVRQGTEGLELADSITGDGHKMLNVPYDCGFFFCRHRNIPSKVFSNPNAAYLKTNEAGEILSPLNTGIENSRRLRGLPLYATLVAYGSAGYASMVENMVRLARRIAGFIQEECPHLELLPREVHRENLRSIFMVVLFRAKDEHSNRELVARINATRRVYVSGTQWDGEAAARFAIAKWDVNVERDLKTIKEVLQGLT